MRKPIFVRPLADGERSRLEAGLRSKELFVLRRCQILLASARGEWAPRIATTLGCDDQTVRNVIRSFESRGLEACLTRVSNRPKTSRAKLDDAGLERLRALLHQSPRQFGKPTGVWTLELAAEVSFAEGITTERVSDETIRCAIKRLGMGWKRANGCTHLALDHQSRPRVRSKKRRRDRLIRWAATHPDWVLGFQDETWWSRFTQPSRHTWTELDRPLRLIEQTVAISDPDPKALACYGLLRPDLDRVWLRFVTGQPVSAITTQFLQWCANRLASEGKQALLMIWDNASWHVSKEVRGWIRAHNRQTKQTGKGVRIITCLLPSKSPWLNNIEPHWVHGKRQVAEAVRLLPARELAERVSAYFDCPYEDHLSIPEQAA